MTPMPLEKALEVAIKRLQGIAVFAEADEAAATLRAFMEKGLPFYKAAEEWGEWYCDNFKGYFKSGDWSAEEARMMKAYRRMREGK